jgi:hypothetical protein
MQALMQNEGLDRSAKQAQVKTMREQNKKQMEKVLTKEQFKQWEDMQKNRLQKGPKMQGMRKQGIV